MHQILAFAGSNAGAGALTNINAASDQNFVQNGSGQWRFYEDYELLAAAVLGATVTAAQWNNATWSGINTPQIYPPILGVVPPTNPQVVDYRNAPPSIPQNEDFGLTLSGGAGGAENEYGVMWIAPKGSNRMIPMPTSPYGSMGRVRMLFTVSITKTVLLWSPDARVNIQNLYKGGTYLILGLNLICATSIAFRLNFPQPPMYRGRKLSPGGLVENAYGNVPLDKGNGWLGPLGYFDTNEFFQLAVLASSTVGAATFTGYIDALYMSDKLMGQVSLPPLM